MTARVILPRALTAYTNDRSELLVDDVATLGDVITRLSSDYPALARRIIDETGELRRHVNVYVGIEDCRRLQGLATPTPDGAEIFVVGSIAGG